jgi:transcriptional regulator with XRE-family HTH domain
MSDLIERKLELVNESTPMSVDTVDLVINDPAQVADRLGVALNYVAKVENEVRLKPFETMLPRYEDDHPIRRFQYSWVPQELGHGEIEDKVQELLGQEPIRPVVNVTASEERLGYLGTLSHHFHDVVEGVYLVRGAMHERIAMTAYSKLIHILEGLGETALADVFKAIRKQEGPHKGFYHAMAEQSLKRAGTFKRWAILRASAHTYEVLGVRSQEDKLLVGKAVLQLVGDEPVESIAHPVQSILDGLFEASKFVSVPKLVQPKLNEVIELARVEYGLSV